LNGRPFTTRDRDNDRRYNQNCAVDGHGTNATGGWWHYDCFQINLNYNYAGPYGFFYLGDKWHYPSFVEIKIRKVGCST